MSIYSASPLITYAPLVNRHATVAGAHFYIHTRGLPVAIVASALNALGEVWPSPDMIALTEFFGVDSADWIDGWQPRGTTAYVADTALVSMSPGYRALRADAPKLCVRLPDIPPAALPAVGYFTACPDTFGMFSALPVESRQFPLVTIAVESTDDLANAMKVGAELIGGWSFMHHAVARPSKQRLGTIANVLKLMEVVDRDGSFQEIEAIFKRDAVLSYKLVSLANSAAFGLSVEVTSLQHALSMIGMARLKRWLTVLLANCGDEATPPALLQSALVRAMFLESIGKALDLDAEQDDLFLLGTFSLLDKILGMPLAEILETVSVPEAIVDALVHRYGAYAGLLQLAEAVERHDDDQLHAICQELTIDGLVVNHALLKAVGDAQLLMHA